MGFFRYFGPLRRFPGPPRWRPLLWLCGLLLLAGPARATHIVGGELQLTHSSGQSYVLTLNLYFDAAGANADLITGSVTASIFDKATNSRMQDVALPLTANTFVAYANPLCARASLSTRRLVYSRELLLPGGTYNAPQGYYVAVEQCCRNLSIDNLVNPGNAAQTFYLEFPAVVRNGQPFLNSSPRQFPALAEYACLGEPFLYDFGGSDADGDSLVYELVTPLNGHATINVPLPRVSAAPYAPVSWRPGYEAANAVPGTPPLRIDRLTGRLSVRPSTLGLFAFGIRCAEYRRGEKIGEVRRDFQLVVLACPPNARPALAVLPAPTGPAPYRPGRDTLRLGPGRSRCVRLRYTDPDPGSRLSLSLRPLNFTGLPTFGGPSSGTVRAPGAPDTLATTLCFPECLDTRGQVWLLDVIVADEGCSQPKRDTVRLAFVSAPLPTGPPTIATTAPAGPRVVARVGSVVSFAVEGTAPFGQAVQLQLSGQGFAPADLGATLTPAAGGSPQRAQFNWPVDCRALVGDSVRTFRLTASTAPCDVPLTASTSVTVVVRYANAPPTLRTSVPLPLPSAPSGLPVVRLPLGAVFTLGLTGTDANADPLTLTAGSEKFALADVGMHFTATSGAGAAAGSFRWEVSCGAANRSYPLDVTFQLLDATCRPLPQRLTVRFEVETPASPELRLYNIITPNGDGQNDEFRLPELPADFCDQRFIRMEVFSRWGQPVFASDSRDFRWPGQGQAGTYYYLATYSDGRRYKGWLEVKP